MNVQEVLEEIIEKLPDNRYSVPSILRKVTQTRDEIIRNFTADQQQSESIVSALDLLEGQAEYPLPCPPKNIAEVEIRTSLNDEYPHWMRLDRRQFDNHYRHPYYYLLSGSIGIHPMPTVTIERGIKIFHVPVLEAITVEGLNGPTGFDPNFDMVLVYGVLKEFTHGPQSKEFSDKYDMWMQKYRFANSGYGDFVVKGRWGR